MERLCLEQQRWRYSRPVLSGRWEGRASLTSIPILRRMSLKSANGSGAT
nr:MAG TPA: hypothetical protein [Caudoviricetes sp.]